MIDSLRNIRRELHRDEEGVAMTEFVIFMPAWVVVLIGVFALGRLGLDTTRVKMTAQKQMWDEVIPLTDSDLDIHMSPRLGGPAAGVHLGGLASDSDNDQQVQDGVEAAIMGGGLGVFGHWGESYARVAPFQIVGSIADFAQVDDLTFRGGTDILNDRSYPKMLLDDSLEAAVPSGSGFAAILGAVLGASGIMPAIGAGVRYGTVFGEVEDEQINMAAGQTTAASAHYDILVAPSPKRGDLETKASDLLAYALLQADEKYFDLFYFGENNYGGSGGSSSTHDVGGALDNANSDIEDGYEEAEEQLEEQCEPFDNQSDCESCTNAGFDNPDDCFPE